MLAKAAAVHHEKSLQNMYKSIQDHGKVSISEIDRSATKFEILGQKFTKPSDLQCNTFAAAYLGPQKSLSAILTSEREKSAGKQLPVIDIVPANRAIGSAIGSVGSIKFKSTTGIRVSNSHEVTDCDAVDLASPFPLTKQGSMQQWTDDKLLKHLPEGRKSESQQSLYNNAERSKHEEQVSKAQGGSDDKKSKNAANFLKEVKARVSAPEYKSFVECIKGLKQHVINIKTVVEAVANLFSAPERIFLLHRFGEFVPAQHRELYETCLFAKTTAVEQLSGRCFDGDKVPEVDKPTGLIGLPRRSRKRPADSTS
ncbi:hypothetical protein L7F22_001960 [Adiantum nelumboides]|nr:hypothetical protein [Adiantum nelumboides]